MKLLLEAGPLAAFLLVYAWRGIIDATLALVIGSVIALLAGRLLQGRFSGLSVFTVAVSVVLGGLTVIYKDASFIMVKPTVVFAAFSLGLAGSHFVGDKVMYERLFGNVWMLPSYWWRRINAAWVLYFAVHAVLNMYVATQYSERTWVYFKIFGFGLMTLVFGVAHWPLIRFLQYRIYGPGGPRRPSEHGNEPATVNR